MGYGVPAGIAANLLTGRTAFTITGDGDFLMNGQELATAVQHGGKSIIVLLNNGMYGTIRMHQEREYPARVSGSHCAIRTLPLWHWPMATWVSASRAPRSSSRNFWLRWHADRAP
jgi:hypothetical protein